jgi:cell wall assembly regulator SMI1
VICDDARVLPEVEESWDRIARWLHRHAPPLAATVNPPATEAALARAEAALGVSLPADLRAWWRRADGMRWTHPPSGRLLPPGFVPHSVEQALASRQTWLDVMRGEESELPPGPAGSPCDVWLPEFMPIAADGGGTELFVDLRGGPSHGCVMEYDKVGAAGYEDLTSEDVSLWPSVTAMLADVAEALERDVPVRDVRIWVDEDGTTWWDGDTERWVSLDRARVDFARLRERYATFVGEARSEGFGAPPPGSWPAEWVAAHVARNTELLVETTRQILATDPVDRARRLTEAWTARDMDRFQELRAADTQAAAGLRYDNADAMDPATLERYAATGLAELAERVARLGDHLCDLAEPLNRARPAAHVRVVDAGTTVVDGYQNWLGVLNGLSERQLPLRTRQLRALR